MTNILTLNSISNKIFEVFDDKYSVSSTVENPEAILLRSFKMHEYDLPNTVLAIGRAGAGVDNIPIAKMTEKGVVVFNTPGANANAVKELAICGLFLASRKIVKGIEWCNTLKGKENVAKLVEEGKGKFGGYEIFGRTLGVVGLGAIGVKLANAAVALGMKVVGSDPFITDENKAMLDKNVTICDFDSLIAVSDYVSLHLPLIDKTKGMINQAVIAKMKDGASILNLSRAGLVDINDLKKALESGKLNAYVVDFPTEDALDSEGIIAIPHLGASTEQAEENCATMASFQLKDYLENGNIKNSVNYPTLVKERDGKCRITVAYNTASSALENLKKLNQGFEFRNRNEIGYAMIDLNEGCTELVEKISNIEGVVTIRLL